MNDAEEDYIIIRKTLYKLMNDNEEAIELMKIVARESEHPTAIKVLGELIKHNADIAEKLMKLQKTKKEVENDRNNMVSLDSSDSVINNNNVFIGSTAELQKMLRDEIVIDVEE